MKEDIAKVYYSRPSDKVPVLWVTFTKEELPDGRTRFLYHEGASPHEKALPHRTIDGAIAWLLQTEEPLKNLERGTIIAIEHVKKGE